MSFSFIGSGSLSYPTTGGSTAATPVGVQNGDYVILAMGTKPDTVTPPTQSGWNLIGTVAGGGGTTGIDTGPVRTTAWYRVWDGTWSMPTPTITGANVNWMQAYAVRPSSVSDIVSITSASGTDSTTGTAWSALCTTDPGIQAGDLCLVASTIPTDVTTPSQFTGEAISAPGVTFGSMFEVSEPDSAAGNDIGGFVFTQTATAGASTGAPTVLATASGTTTNVRGSSLLIRLRSTPSYTPSAYDNAVLADNPKTYFITDGSNTTDLTGRGHTLAYAGGVTTGVMPNGDTAAVFDGATGYAAIADADDLSVPGVGGILTWEAWVRPDALEFPGAESTGDGPAVYPLIKGENYQTSGDQEYAFRMYSLSASRPNRFSAYVFNPPGGLGAGSYFQGGLRSTDGGTPPLLAAGDWVHVVAKIDTVNLEADGWGTVRLYRNGVLMDHDSLGDPYFIVPENKGAPLHIGARPGHSWFQGAVAKVAVYGDLSDARIAAHYAAMVPPTVSGSAGLTSSSTLATSGRVETSGTVALSGTATLSAAGTRQSVGSVSLTGTGTLSAGAEVTSPPPAATNYSIFNDAAVGAHDSDPGPVNLALEFSVSTTAWVTELKVYRASTAMSGTVRPLLWQVDSATSGTLLVPSNLSFSLGSTTGWKSVTLATPVQLTAGQRYRVGFYSTAGYAASGGYFNPTANTTSGILTLYSASNATGQDQGAYGYSSAGVFPTNSFNNSLYACDLTVTDTDPSGPPVGGTVAGASAFSTTSLLTVAGVQGISGTAALTTVSTTAVAATRTRTASVAMTSASSLTTSTPIRTVSASVALTSSTTLATSAPTRIVTAGVSLGAAATLTVTAPVRKVDAAAALVASGTLLVSGMRTVLGSAGLAAASVLTAGTFTRTRLGAVALAAASAMTVTAPVRTRPVVASLSTASVLLVSGEILGTSTGATALASNSVLTVSASRSLFVGAAISAASTLTTGAVRSVLGASVLTATSSLTTNSVRGVAAMALLLTELTLGVGALVTRNAVVVLSTQAELDASPTIEGMIAASVVMDSLATLLTSGVISRPSSVILLSDGTLVTGGTRERPASVIMEAGSTFSAQVKLLAEVAVSLEVLASLDVSGVLNQQSSVTLQSLAVLTAMLVLAARDDLSEYTSARMRVNFTWADVRDNESKAKMQLNREWMPR